MQPNQTQPLAYDLAAAKLAITVNEFLSIASIGRTRFYKEVKAGRIKVVKVGVKTLIPATEPAAWLVRLSGQAA